MKHFITLILILLTLQYLRSQEYKPFNFDSGEWYCKYDTKGGMFGGVDHDTYYAIDSIKFYCNGDTIINEVRFKKLMYSGYTSSQIVNRTYISGYYAAIRNDTINRKVYIARSLFNSSYEGTGELLYDFNLSIGDSLPNSCFFDEKDTISYIDSIIYCNQYFKRYNTSSGYYIIEGIGSKDGFLPLNCMTNLGWLLCYQENNNELCEDCGLFTSMATHSSAPLIIYPNPTTGKVQINTDLEIRYIDLFDIKGTFITRLNYDKGFIELQKNGCYILHIYTDKDIIIAKTIKE